jgi:hypothetical protein
MKIIDPAKKLKEYESILKDILKEANKYFDKDPSLDDTVFIVETMEKCEKVLNIS